jgi:hypothetical protein
MLVTLEPVSPITLKNAFLIKSIIQKHFSWAPVTHTCNPSYLGRWDQEDPGMKSARTNTSQNPISKNNQSKMDWRHSSNSIAPALQAQSPEFKLQSHQKNKKLKSLSKPTEP